MWVLGWVWLLFGSRNKHECTDVRYLGSVDAWQQVDWVGHYFSYGDVITTSFSIDLMLEANNYDASAGSV